MHPRVRPRVKAEGSEEETCARQEAQALVDRLLAESRKQQEEASSQIQTEEGPRLALTEMVAKQNKLEAERHSVKKKVEAFR